MKNLRIPSIYTMLNLEALKEKTIFDYNSGPPDMVRKIRTLLEDYDIDYIPYDLTNLSDADNCYAFERRFDADIYICSNVFNTIKEDYLIQEIIDNFSTFIIDFRNNSKNKIFFFKIYEGNKTKQGKYTKKNCWQRNQPVENYIEFFNWDFLQPIIYKNIITNKQGRRFLK